ncbi:MAG: DUF188 domain-containing protein [Brevibacillus sp.]|nr:DUF188 domain-containing protein [Brevibacillus sp.]
MARRVLIDADACPKQALSIAETLCQEKGWTCITFATFNHARTGPNHIVVDVGPEAVDLRLANEAAAGDVVVTQDIGLAALVMGKKARALTGAGYIFDAESLPFQLEVRHEKARIRRAGGRTRGPSARTREDDRRFGEALLKLMEEGE